MIGLVCSTMKSLLGFTIFVIFGVVTSQNHDVNSQNPIVAKKGSVEPTTPVPPASTGFERSGIEYQHLRLEVLLVEKLETLRTEVRDINTRLQSLEYQSSEVHSTVDNIKDGLGAMSQCCSGSATPVHQNNENLETKVENLDKNIQTLMDSTKIWSSGVETVKQDVSSLINVTRSLVNSSSNLVSKKVYNEGLQELKDLQTATSSSCPLNLTVDKQYPKNCREVQEFEKTISGNYMIQPGHASKPFEAVCELETRGGGWTIIQRRFDGSQNFYLGWEDYKNGFGNFGGEFWFGLENIHLLTGFEANELLIEIGDFESQNGTAFYSQFNVGSEMEGYSLKVLGDYSGNAGDSLTYSAGMKFTTKEIDQDHYSLGNCAQFNGGAWWYYNCAYSNLNGKYFDREFHLTNDNVKAYHSVFWHGFRKFNGLKNTRMLVRPKV